MLLAEPLVLLAVSPRGLPRMSRILSECVVERAIDLDDLSRLLRQRRFELAIVGAHFDGSNAGEALKLVLRYGRGVPVVCVRDARFCRALTGKTLAAFHAASQHEVRDFVDIPQFPDNHIGNAQARSILFRIVLRSAEFPARSDSLLISCEAR